MTQKLVAILAVSALAGTGCTVAKIYGRGSQPILLNQPTQKYTVVRHFEKDITICFDYTGAFDVTKGLAGVLGDIQADALINVGIDLKVTVPNFLVNMITFGIANCKTATIEGDAVRWKKGGSSSSED